MSVLIKGLSMPKNCQECPLLYVTSICDGFRDCPLIPVPPHGRLIDADAIIKDMEEALWDWETVDGIAASAVLKQTITDLRNAPTIIQASGKDTDVPTREEEV